MIYLLIRDSSFEVDRDAFGIIKNAKGMPMFKDHPYLNISISHSEDYQVYAVSARPVGIDIQSFNKASGVAWTMEGCLAVAERFFAPDEAAYVREGSQLHEMVFENNQECLKRFFRIWTEKESYVKYVGRGIDDYFSRFSAMELAAEKKVHFQHVDLRPDYDLCICSREKENIMKL